VVNIDDNKKNSFQKIQKYFTVIYEFWATLAHTLASNPILASQNDVYSRIGAFVPTFLKEGHSSLQQLHHQISLGLTYQQAMQTIYCLKLEIDAHKRDNLVFREDDFEEIKQQRSPKDTSSWSSRHSSSLSKFSKDRLMKKSPKKQS
jgi:FtsZ-binding cell division protein ZapB